MSFLVTILCVILYSIIGNGQRFPSNNGYSRRYSNRYRGSRRYGGSRRNNPYRRSSRRYYRRRRLLTDECQYLESNIRYPWRSRLDITYPINSCFDWKDRDIDEPYSLKYVCSPWFNVVFLVEYENSTDCTGSADIKRTYARWGSTHFNCDDEVPICQYAEIKFYDDYDCSNSSSDSNDMDQYKTVKQVTDYCIRSTQKRNEYYTVKCIAGSVIVTSYHDDDTCSNSTQKFDRVALNVGDCYEEEFDRLGITGKIADIKCYDVDDELIENTQNCDINETEYILTPQVSTLFDSSDVLYIRGPCFDDDIFNQTNVTWSCQFGSMKTSLNILNHTVGSCSIPANVDSGEVIFALISSEKQFYPYLPLTTFTYIDILFDGEFNVNASVVSDLTNGASITITWDTNITNDQNATLKFLLFEIIQDFMNDDLPQIAPVTILSNDQPNDGEFTTELVFDRRDLINHAPLAVIQLMVNDDEKYYSNSFTIAPTNSSTFCQSWAETDARTNGNISAETPCPDIYPASLENERRGGTCQDINFEKDKCQDGNEYCELFNNGAYNCLRSSKDGQQCCYTPDNALCTSPPCTGSSKLLDTAHQYSLYFDYLNNIQPKLLCCANATSIDCETYYNRRPISTGKRTRALIRCSAIRGDPHFITLDGVEYSFNGIGDYYLVYNDQVSIVTRLKNFNCGSVNHGLLIYDKNDDVTYEVVIRKDPMDDGSLQTDLVLFYNGHRLSLDDEMKYNFGDYVINYFNDFIELNLINIRIDIKIILRRLDEIHYLDYVFVFDEKYSNKIEGLLGNWDGDQNNDFKLRDSNTMYDIDSLNHDEMHQFGLSWIVTNNDEESNKFFEKETYPFENITDWNPINVNGKTTCGDISFTDVELNNICGDNDPCKLDILATGIIELGNLTKTFGNKVKESIQKLEEQFTTTTAPTSDPTYIVTTNPSKTPSTDPTTKPTMKPITDTIDPVVSPTMNPTSDAITTLPTITPTLTKIINGVPEALTADKKASIKLILVGILIPCVCILICILIYIGYRNKKMNRSKNYENVSEGNEGDGVTKMISDDQLGNKATDMTPIENETIGNGINDENDSDSDSANDGMLTGTTAGYDNIDYDVYDEATR